jgi:hypothetical protein
MFVGHAVLQQATIPDSCTFTSCSALSTFRYFVHASAQRSADGSASIFLTAALDMCGNCLQTRPKLNQKSACVPFKPQLVKCQILVPVLSARTQTGFLTTKNLLSLVENTLNTCRLVTNKYHNIINVPLCLREHLQSSDPQGHSKNHSIPENSVTSVNACPPKLYFAY